jgi:TPR repeat protein
MELPERDLHQVTFQTPFSLPLPNILCQTFSMRKPTATLCLTIAVLLGSAGVSWGDEFEKGQITYKLTAQDASRFEKGLKAYDSDDYLNALRAWIPVAENGHPRAQFLLGVIYDQGRGVPENLPAAIRWYTLSATQGNELAQFSLALMYREGRGVARNIPLAIKWFKRAAEWNGGFGPAIYELGLLYENGEGIPQDYVQSLEWFKRAAEGGHALAQFTLGLKYERGKGVEKDYLSAAKWYQRSAKYRKDARDRLGVLLASERYQNALKEQRAREKRIENEPFRETCSSFGFKEGSKEMSNCMFELYKIDQSKSQSPNVIQNAPSTRSGTAPEVRAFIEEQRRAAEAQRKAIEAQQGIEIMRQGLEMMKPNRQNNSNGFRIGPNGGMWNCRNGICTK